MAATAILDFINSKFYQNWVYYSSCNEKLRMFLLMVSMYFIVIIIIIIMFA